MGALVNLLSLGDRQAIVQIHVELENFYLDTFNNAPGCEQAYGCLLNIPERFEDVRLSKMTHLSHAGDYHEVLWVPNVSPSGMLCFS